ncbi:hypothetical protein RAS1_18160 [Phycisphaerae bacterium RAS1]|nr:hypothetical protein RAS1_18160 [Phycisphaerae bacterium RAS1]
MLRERAAQIGAGVAALLSLPAAFAGAVDPWADGVVAFSPGADGNPAYPDPATAIGSPERFTGEGTDYFGVVSVFNPPFGGDEIVSLGAGGSLTVRFNEPITNDPAHAYGVDLIIFSNGFFIDEAWPAGVVGGRFTTGTMRVRVSQNGVDFHDAGVFDPSLYPTQGYRDVGPYSATPGDDPTEFLRPLNPSLTFADYQGQSLGGVLSLYDGSGGGIPVDIAGAGLSSVNFVRVEAAGGVVQVDAFATVPEPSSLLAFGLFGWRALWRRG